MILFKITKYLLLDYALNKFLDSVEESLTVYLDVKTLQEGMTFNKIIFTYHGSNTEYRDCKIELLDSSPPMVMVISHKRVSNGNNGAILSSREGSTIVFNRIKKMIPGDILEVSYVEDRIEIAQKVITLSTKIVRSDGRDNSVELY